MKKKKKLILVFRLFVCFFVFFIKIMFTFLLLFPSKRPQDSAERWQLESDQVLGVLPDKDGRHHRRLGPTRAPGRARAERQGTYIKFAYS